MNKFKADENSLGPLGGIQERNDWECFRIILSIDPFSFHTSHDERSIEVAARDTIATKHGSSLVLVQELLVLSVRQAQYIPRAPERLSRRHGRNRERPHITLIIGISTGQRLWLCRPLRPDEIADPFFVVWLPCFWLL